MFRSDLAAALSISILLWRDSVSITTRFPRIVELVRIELGRVLTHPCIGAALPSYKAKMGVLFSTLSMAEPWDIHIDSVMRAFESRFTTDELDRIGRAMATSAHHDNAAFDMILRNGKQPTATPERIIETVEGVARVLKIDAEVEKSIEKTVREVYYGVYMQLRGK